MNPVMGKLVAFRGMFLRGGPTTRLCWPDITQSSLVAKTITTHEALRCNDNVIAPASLYISKRF